MVDRQLIRLTVNGTEHDVVTEPRRSLADVLRSDLGYTGTHVTCEQGICGVCTVILDGAAVRSCLVLGVQADDCHVETVESLAVDDELSPLQQAFVDNHGLQCGFCTPGFLMLLTAFLREHPDPSDDEIKEAVAANLCRCTGYRGILDAVRSVRRDDDR